MGRYTLTPLESYTVLMSKLFLVQRCLWEYAQRISYEKSVVDTHHAMVFFLFD